MPLVRMLGVNTSVHNAVAEWIQELYNPTQVTDNGLDAVMINQFLYNLNYYDPITHYLEQLYEIEENRMLYVAGKNVYLQKEENGFWSLCNDEEVFIKFVRSVAYALHERCQKVIEILEDNDVSMFRACKTVQYICDEIVRDETHDFFLIAMIRIERTLERLHSKYFKMERLNVRSLNA